MANLTSVQTILQAAYGGCHPPLLLHRPYRLPKPRGRKRKHRIWLRSYTPEPVVSNARVVLLWLSALFQPLRIGKSSSESTGMVPYASQEALEAALVQMGREPRPLFQLCLPTMQ